MARLVFFNRFYWPDEPATAQLLVDLAEALAASGHSVAVVTSAPASPKMPSREERNGVAIHRVRSLRLGGSSLFARILDLATFYPTAFLRLLRVVRRDDLLVAMTDPPLSGVLAGFVAKLRGARLVHWVQDIYPEIAVALTGHRWLLATRPARDAAWRQAIACFVPGETMAATVRAARVSSSRIFVSANWAPAGLQPPAPGEVNALRAAWDLSDKFVVAYSGNLGRVHDLTPIVEVATLLRDEPEFAFIFIGGGAARASIECLTRDRQLGNVHFHPAQPRPQLAASLGLGDVHFVTLKPGAERSVFPSKLYGITQIGRPVAFVGAPDSDVARLVSAHGFGASFTRDQTAEIAAWLRRLRTEPSLCTQLAEAALRFAPAGRDRAIDQWRDLLGSPKLAAPAAPR